MRLITFRALLRAITRAAPRMLNVPRSFRARKNPPAGAIVHVKGEVRSWEFKQSSINGADTVKRAKSCEILRYPRGLNSASKLRLPRRVANRRDLASIENLLNQALRASLISRRATQRNSASARGIMAARAARAAFSNRTLSK